MLRFFGFSYVAAEDEPTCSYDESARMGELNIRRMSSLPNVIPNFTEGFVVFKANLNTS